MKLASGANLSMRITWSKTISALPKASPTGLQDAGHAVDMLHDGSDADAYLKDDAADLIILDINLPGIDGLTLLKDMRARGDPRPVILLTARAETEDRVIGLDAGADDYLIKPFEMAELEARVRALVAPARCARNASSAILDRLNSTSAARQLFDRRRRN